MTKILCQLVNSMIYFHVIPCTYGIGNGKFIGYSYIIDKNNKEIKSSFSSKNIKDLAQQHWPNESCEYALSSREIIRNLKKFYNVQKYDFLPWLIEIGYWGDEIRYRKDKYRIISLKGDLDPLNIKEHLNGQ